MISVKFHEKVVSLCDAELIGKHFEEGKFALDVTERFYRGEEMNLSQAFEVLEDATSINLVGKKVIELALGVGLICEDDIITIEGVPHVQIYAF